VTLDIHVAMTLGITPLMCVCYAHLIDLRHQQSIDRSAGRLHYR